MTTNLQVLPALPTDGFRLCTELEEPLGRKTLVLPHPYILRICSFPFWVFANDANVDCHVITRMVMSDGEYALPTSLLLQALLWDYTYSKLAPRKASTL